jgi:putative transposase
VVDVPAPACPGIIARDFSLVVTATFRRLYVFVVIEHGSQRLIHCNVTTHPSATWTVDCST